MIYIRSSETISRYPYPTTTQSRTENTPQTNHKGRIFSLTPSLPFPSHLSLPFPPQFLPKPFPLTPFPHRSLPIPFPPLFSSLPVTSPFSKPQYLPSHSLTLVNSKLPLLLKALINYEFKQKAQVLPEISFINTGCIIELSTLQGVLLIIYLSISPKRLIKNIIKI